MKKSTKQSRADRTKLEQLAKSADQFVVTELKVGIGHTSSLVMEDGYKVIKTYYADGVTLRCTYIMDISNRRYSILFEIQAPDRVPKSMFNDYPHIDADLIRKTLHSFYEFNKPK